MLLFAFYYTNMWIIFAANLGNNLLEQWLVVNVALQFKKLQKCFN